MEQRTPIERDLRLDFFRGLALWMIFLDHIPSRLVSDAASWITIRNFGFSDATEIFIFISGYTASLVYGRKLAQQGFVKASARILHMVAADDELVDGSEVAAADRQVCEFDAVRQPVVTAEQDLARGTEVDDGTQPEQVEPFHIRAGQLAERVAAEQAAAHDLKPVDAAVAADVPHVHRAVEGHMT